MIKENGIDFITAHEGGIKMCGKCGADELPTVVGWGTTAKHIAYVCATKGFKDTTVKTSSSMDFADEEGFDHYDGAKVLWAEAMDMLTVMECD